MVKVKQGCCCTSFIILTIIGLCIWFAIRPRIPICTIEEFTVFNIQQTVNSTYNNTIYYDLKVKNRNTDDVGIYYDTLNVTFYYKRNIDSFPVEIGDATFSPFYLRRSRSTHRVGSIGSIGINWERETTPRLPPVMFRVELLTTLRYRKPFWKSKRYHLLVGADLKVNGKGVLVNRGVKLRSKAGRNNMISFWWVAMLGILIFMLSW
ncbi:protein NDR1-like [Spinacia oleracea]|uniref:Protein NDR1-like n=1 Tax=Spinacia oleracea TaxID=3562 RepID=A0A9R0IVM0_SPIOL|nr:protein NDR1-like [Spinacia oleracea]